MHSRTHTHTNGRARTHARTHTLARTRACTHAHARNPPPTHAHAHTHTPSLSLSRPFHASDGYWNGTTCEECASGWFGEACAQECLHGYTQGKLCLCHTGYATANCSVVCPGPADNRCSGHGTCLDGHERDGSCLCDPHWYSEDCSVYCEPQVTCPFEGVYPEPHFVCNPRTGACECQSNATGYWAGAECNRCEEGYWGVACSGICDCNGNGKCGWLDGVCECYQVGARVSAASGLGRAGARCWAPDALCPCAPGPPQGCAEEPRFFVCQGLPPRTANHQPPPTANRPPPSVANRH